MNKATKKAMGDAMESFRALLDVISEDYGDPEGELDRIREHAEGARETLGEYDRQHARRIAA